MCLCFRYPVSGVGVDWKSFVHENGHCCEDSRDCSSK